jgi:hypothetical protein
MIYLPMTFRLFDQTWTIRAALQGEIGDDLGQCRPDSHEIVLNPNQAAESMTHTMFHELVHSWELKQHLELSERDVDIIALCLIHFFRGNPEYIRLLQEQQNG